MARRLASVAAILGLGAIAGHHLWLLWTRVASGQLLDPDIGFRWAAGLLLALGLVALRRSGVPLLRGNKALVYWLLVLLFHGVATGPVGEQDRDLAQRAQAALLVWQASVAPLLLAVAAWRGRLHRRQPVQSSARAPGATTGPAIPLPPGCLLQLAPRPPPA